MATRSQVERTVDSRLDGALAAGRARHERGELARSVAYDARRRRLNVELISGIAIAIPVAQVECLASATPAEIRAVEVTGKGLGLWWPALDADLSVPDLVAGCFGTRTWMKSLARRAGSVTSEAKAAAARENGKKGGRPRKVLALTPGPSPKGEGRRKEISKGEGRKAPSPPTPLPKGEGRRR